MTEGVGVLAASHLTVRTSSRNVAVDDVTLDVRPGEVLGLVGETGSGKTLTMRACLGLLSPGLTADADRLVLAGVDVRCATAGELREVLGRHVGFVPQNTSNFLHPLLRVRDQLVDGYLTWHGRARRTSALDLASDLLERTGIEDVRRVMAAYPAQLSGGMRQRVNIAMALMGDPLLVVADEPTAALDALTRSQVADLLVHEVRERGSSLVLVSHDLGLVSSYCDRVAVMYAGRVVEEGPCAPVAAEPLHPYTVALMASVPRAGRPRGERLPEVGGSMPETGRDRQSCSFAPRCPSARPGCFEEMPAWAGPSGEGARAHRALCPFCDRGEA